MVRQNLSHVQSLKPKVAAMLIVKADDDSEVKQLARALGSINGYVDAIYIQLNAPQGVNINASVRQVAEQFTKEIQVYTWTGNFARARQALLEKVPKRYDWVMWLDTDDIVDNPQEIVPVASVMPEDVNGVHILYDYQTDEFGNVTVAHWTARLVRNNDSYRWKSSFDDAEIAVHETLVPKRDSRAVANNEWKVIHKASPEHYRQSLLRNIDLLEQMAERQARTTNGIDPRILYYLASHYYDAYRFKEARQLFVQYLQASGWAEERAEAHIYMGKLLLMENKVQAARTAFLMAIGEYLHNPGAYLELGKLESKEERWEQAADWLLRGIQVKPSLTGMVKYNYDYELFTLYAQACANLGGKRLEDASKYAQKALKLRPYDPNAKANRDHIQKLIRYRDQLRGTAKLLMALKEEDPKRIPPFLDALPKSLQDSTLVIDAKHEYSAPKKWSKRSVAIYVGHGPLGIWGPWSLDDGGTGGSEEAVVRLSNELTARGWRVTVFGMPGERAGMHNQVSWRHYWEINNKDSFDVLVSWRQPAFFDYNWKARKKYLWLHDVVPAEELTPERIKRVTKVIYVSSYHASRPENNHIPASKKLISSNGITAADFDALGKRPPKRSVHRCIYMSANERGLRLLYDIWPDVRRAVPAAELHTFYGWHSFDAVNRDNPERMAWKASMQLKAQELEGVVDHGRIGQTELNNEIFKSGVFAYPCTFPEVSCHPAGVFVNTTKGDVSVEKLSADMSVITHTGNVQPITAIRKRWHEGTMYKLNLQCSEDLELTGEHPVYAITPTKSQMSESFTNRCKLTPHWVEAQHLKQGDIMLVPRHKKLDGVYTVEFSKYTGSRSNNLPTTTKFLKDTTVTPKLAEWFGFFAGDGSATTKTTVTFVVAKRHPDDLQLVKDGFRTIGLESTVLEKGECWIVKADSGVLARFLKEQFYDSERTKVIPNWLQDLYPDEAFSGLLRSDGSSAWRDGSINYSFTNTSRKLVSQFRRLLSYKGIAARVMTREHKAGKRSYYLDWRDYTQQKQLFYVSDDDYLYVRIKKITEREFSDYVYNIDVAEEHSYLANGAAVHNCITAMKAQAGGAWPVVSTFAALEDTVLGGDKVDMGEFTPEDIEHYKQTLIARLKNPPTDAERAMLMGTARVKYDWSKAAKQWSDEFN